MATIIRNGTAGSLTLPAPLRGTVGPGDSFVVLQSPVEVEGYFEQGLPTGVKIFPAPAPSGRLLDESLLASGGYPVETFEATAYVASLQDLGKLMAHDNAAQIDYTLPSDQAVDFPVGGCLTGFQAGAGQVVFAAGAGATMIQASNATLNPGSSFSVVKTKPNTWLVIGDLTTAA